MGAKRHLPRRASPKPPRRAINLTAAKSKRASQFGVGNAETDESVQILFVGDQYNLVRHRPLLRKMRRRCTCLRTSPCGTRNEVQPLVRQLVVIASFMHNHFSIATESVSRYAESTMLVSEQARALSTVKTSVDVGSVRNRASTQSWTVRSPFPRA